MNTSSAVLLSQRRTARILLLVAATALLIALCLQSAMSWLWSSWSGAGPPPRAYLVIVGLLALSAWALHARRDRCATAGALVSLMLCLIAGGCAAFWAGVEVGAIPREWHSCGDTWTTCGPRVLDELLRGPLLLGCADLSATAALFALWAAETITCAR